MKCHVERERSVPRLAYIQCQFSLEMKRVDCISCVMYTSYARGNAMTLEFKNVRSAGRLSELVREQLEEAILSGKVKVNEQLPTETDLGESFGVSRTVIREALQRLEGQGLVHSRIGSGSYVSPYPMERMKAVLQRFAALNPEAETFMNLLDLRIVIETETCGRLAERHDAEAISDLRGILKRMTQSRKQLDEFAKADMDFHQRISQA